MPSEALLLAEACIALLAFLSTWVLVATGAIVASQAVTTRGLTAPPMTPPGTGVRRAGPRDAWTLYRWTLRGYVYGATHGDRVGRVLSASMTIVAAACAPAVVLAHGIMLARPWATYYATDEAILAVRAARGAWHLEDHTCARPHTGAGARLRARVIPHLLAYVDAHAITVHATAASTSLARTYQDTMTMRDLGPAFPRGRRLVYEPPTHSD